MSNDDLCPECGAEIPSAAPAGQCPKCMMKAGFETGDPASSGFEPPSVELLSELFPQLEIVELVGKGGMGAVYKARQPNLDRFVAIKVLPPEVGRDAAFAERFAREARAMARLSHPNIVAIYDFGQREGLFYLVMDYVDGANLRQALQAGNLKPEQALAIVPQICDALQFAHNEGIVHRDIKPENVLIDLKGRVKIADFGLAKLFGEEQIDVALTQANHVMGTLRYMAPEQMYGPHDVDHRADIYSLGVVFYELLTGDVPTGHFDPPSKRVQIDARLDEVVLRALAQERDKRYQHVSEVKTDVEMLARNPPPRVDKELPRGEKEPAEPKPDFDHIQAVNLEIETAREELKAPATGLIAVGFLTCLTSIVPIFLAVKTLHDIFDSRITFATDDGQTSLAAYVRYAVLFALVLLLPSLGIIIAWGGWMMKHLHSRAMATTASLLALVPCQPVFVLGPIFGIWSLIVLRRSNVKAAFNAKSGLPILQCEEPDEKAGEEAEEDADYVGVWVAYGIAFGTAIGVVFDNIGIGVALGAAFGVAMSANKSKETESVPVPPAKPDLEFQSLVRRRLKIPATGLLLAGILNLLAAPLALLIPFIVQRWGGFDEGSGFVEGSSTFAEAMFLCIIIAAASLASGIILVIGSARMFDLQSHPIAMFAAMVAILPVAIGFPLSLPLGIWTLVVLVRHDVKTTFAV